MYFMLTKLDHPCAHLRTCTYRLMRIPLPLLLALPCRVVDHIQHSLIQANVAAATSQSAFNFRFRAPRVTGPDVVLSGTLSEERWTGVVGAVVPATCGRSVFLAVVRWAFVAVVAGLRGSLAVAMAEAVGSCLVAGA